MKSIDLCGRRFGSLTVESIANNLGKKRAWNCVCDCGNGKVARSDHLKSGATQSCGCFMVERVIEANTRHGMTNTRVYRIWRNMINRCHYEKYQERHLYGGRGISVCDRWRSSFQSFVDDMGVPDDSLSIDRINVNGNYEPSNCRWATAKEQAANRRPRA